MQKIAGLCGRGVLAVIAPADKGFAFKYVNNGVLLAVMVDAGPSGRLHYEDAGL